jgi:hypothetical protein
VSPHPDLSPPPVWLRAAGAPCPRTWWVLVVYLGPGETLGRLARPSSGDAFGRRSSSLEAWLRSPVSTPTNLPGESPKSVRLGGVDVLHAVSSLEASPGECDAR